MTQYPSAVSRVFSIHELTETILLRAYNLSIPAPTLSPNPKAANSTEYKQAFLLPAKAHSAGMRWLLCTANRVNRFWNTVLSTSPTLQQHLFFQWRGTQRDRDVKFNPLLASTFTWGYFTYNNKICPDDLYTETSKFREAIVYPAASWRKMFPVVPPVRYMYVDQRLHTEQGIGTGHIDLDGVLQNDGLRMGMLFDVAEEWKKPFYGSSFNLAWMGDVDVHTFHRPDKEPSVGSWILPMARHIISALPSALHERLTPSPKLFPTERILPSSKLVLKDDASLGVWDDETGRWMRGCGAKYPEIESRGKAWGLCDIEWYEEKLA